MFGADVSLGTVCHALHITSDSHHANGGTQKEKIIDETWKIRSLLPAEKLENVKFEMKRLSINTLGPKETQWKSIGILISDNCNFIHSRE